MAENSIQIRQIFEEADIRRVSDMAYAIFPIDYGAYVPQSHIQDFLDEFQSPTAIQKQMENGHAYFLVEQGREIAGYLGLHIEPDAVELSKIYLNLDKRGQGIGGFVIKWLDEYVQENGAKVLKLLVLKNNTNAIRFYEKNGFTKNGTFERHFDTGNVEVNLKMQKSYESPLS